jgi:glycosyltransferase involved in cell wall biosynthesis
VRIPKVSVCIPTYNGASYLGQAIESVLAQDFEDFEVVICDDASTDGTPELCSRYEDLRIRYIRFEENAGQAGNFNRCFREAKGELLTLLSADDYFLPGLLSECVARLNEHSEAGFVVGATENVDAASLHLSTSRRWPEDRYFQRGEFFEHLLLGAVVNTLSLVVRRERLEKGGYFRTDITWGHDWEWILRLAENCAVCYVSRPLAAYRVHDGSGTAEILYAAKNGAQERGILCDVFERLPENGDKRRLRRSAYRALGRRHMYFAEQAILSGRRSVARNNLFYASLADPVLLTRPTFWALALGSIGPRTVYTHYRSARKAVEPTGTRS